MVSMKRREKIKYLIDLLEGRISLEDQQILIYMSFDEGRTYTENITGRILTKEQLPKCTYSITMDISK